MSKEYLEVKSLNKKEFDRVVNKIQSSKNLKIVFNNYLIFFIEDLFDLIKKNNVKLTFLKMDNLDIISLKKAKKFFHENVFMQYKDQIEFNGFNDKELLILLGVYNYLIFNGKTSSLNFKKKQFLLLTKHFDFIKYKLYREFLSYFFKIPFSHFIFTSEKNYKRFIFVTYFYSEDIKNNVFELLKLTPIKNQNLISTLKNENPFKVIERIGIGYKFNSKRERYSIYISFFPNKLKEIKNLLDSLNINKKITYENLYGVGIDFYKNSEIVKFYYYEQFNEQLESKDLTTLFHKKNCTKVIKYTNQEIKVKYEFKLTEFFKEDEALLKKYKFDVSAKTIVFYLNKTKVEKKVSYYY